MLNRLFPKQFDNAYRGHWLAIWIFALVMFVKAMQGVMSIVNTRDTAMNADAIPLDSYGAAGRDMVLSLFAILGLQLLVIPLQSVVVLIRYRAMIPLMYLLFLVLHAANRLLHMLHPSVIAGDRGEHSFGFYVNLTILAITIAGFASSLMNRAPARTNGRSA